MIVSFTGNLYAVTETDEFLKGRSPMKQTRLLLILFAVLAMFTILAGTTAAQSVDVDSMSNEELLALLQTIMLKLEQNSETDTEGKDTESTITLIPTSTRGGSTTQVTNQETKKHSIYKNKKLIIGRMPDSWFIRKQPGGGGGDDGGGSDNMRTLEFHYGDYTFTIDIPEGDYGDYGIPTDVWTAW